MKYFWLGLVASVLLFTTGCDASTAVQNARSKLAEIRAKYMAEYHLSEPTNNSNGEPSTPQKTCSNEDYTTTNTSLPSTAARLNLDYAQVISLTSASYAKLTNAIWWGHCNGNSYFGKRGVLYFNESGLIGGGDALPNYDLVRNLPECVGYQETTEPTSRTGCNIRYCPSYSLLTELPLTNIPGDYHVRDYTALSSLQGLTCLESLSLPSVSALKNIATPFYLLNSSWRPMVDIAPLQDHPQLKLLDLSNYLVDNFATLSKLTNLEALTLSNTVDSNDLHKLHTEVLAGLTKLKFLNLSYTNTKDLQPLRELTELQELYLNNTLVDEGYYGGLRALIDPLKDSQMPKLQVLEVANTAISDISGLGNFLELTKLNLSGTQVHELAPLLEMKKLQDLNLSDIWQLLNLMEWQKNYKILSQLKQLDILDVRNSGSPKSLCPELQAALPRTKVLCP